jgi:hypothetical protein
MLKLNLEQLLEAIENLYEAVAILESVLQEIETGAMRGILLSERLAEAWYKVNCCRLYTEGDLHVEELNLEAMGLISDAKCMMDSLIGWRKGMTFHGRLAITTSIHSASQNLLLALCELEDWLNKRTGEELPAIS